MASGDHDGRTGPQSTHVKHGFSVGLRGRDRNRCLRCYSDADARKRRRRNSLRVPPLFAYHIGQDRLGEDRACASRTATTSW